MDYYEPPKTFADVDRTQRPAVVECARPTATAPILDLEKKQVTVDAITLAGGRIHSDHHQPATKLNQKHTLVAMGIEYSNGLYVGAYTLSPNSVRKESFGLMAGKELFSFGSEHGLKFSVLGVGGFSTGYLEGLPMPFVGAIPRLQLFDARVGDGHLSVGLSRMYIPYVLEKQASYISTTPFLSLRYTFGRESAPRAGIATSPAEYRPPYADRVSSVVFQIAPVATDRAASALQKPGALCNLAP